MAAAPTKSLFRSAIVRVTLDQNNVRLIVAAAAPSIPDSFIAWIFVACVFFFLLRVCVFPQVHEESGMLVGLKNAFELLGDTSEDYDFAVSEECHEWDE